MGEGRRREFIRLAAAAGAVVITMAGVLTGVGLILVNSGSKSTVSSADTRAAPATAKQADQRITTVAAGKAPLAVGALGASAPRTLSIPAIGLDRDKIIELGQTSYGAMEVPGNAGTVGWFTQSRTPGEPGVSVIAGHIRFAHERGAFYQLAELSPGDVVTITRHDGSTADFTVYRVETRPDATGGLTRAAGTAAVAGSSPELRLVTGGARFDSLPGEHVNELVVFARMTGTG
ncbi:Sortase family protein [Amycolatopsis marina]|uniref:Sortase family protein n=1 Tax=Amycolatopsis marina TaxID=490629 RepID=A0A1I1CUD2_9PSEU|nr:class F sortase [Amycolatopsis marina]SFB64043.1 Sortase family protein [Amycolatopsis marina]